MDGERQMSLEELIQDETTDEVIESTTTASQKMSVDNTTASELTAADATSLPEHDFIKKLITGKTGKKKGKTTISYMILMGSTPTLLKQVFIISCQVDENTFVPCLYAMIPDKKRDAYDTLFSMMKECLSRRGLSLSAQYFMSNFELNFKNSFMSFFPNVECKGCLFHYSKAVISEVNKHGFKQDFSDVKKNSTFFGFIHAILGLPHVPLQRLNEGIRNCLPRLQLLCAPISKLNSQSLKKI